MVVAMRNLKNLKNLNYWGERKIAEFFQAGENQILLF
jgi:hypothetical protein